MQSKVHDQRPKERDRTGTSMRSMLQPHLKEVCNAEAFQAPLGVETVRIREHPLRLSDRLRKQG